MHVHFKSQLIIFIFLIDKIKTIKHKLAIKNFFHSLFNMTNPNFFRMFDNNSDEDRTLNDGIVSIIGDDYVLNFLNDSEVTPKR